MATDTATQAEGAPGHHDAGAGVHPTEKQYWSVFVLLVAMTGVEITWSYLGFHGPALVVPLMIMMVLKFMLVAGAFMHLYFDLKIINGRLFTMAFGGALLLAVAVYVAVFGAFRFHI
jgi:cytochrome c oxidase subunit IV